MVRHGRGGGCDGSCTPAAAVSSGDSKALELRILATHRLKTASPAGSLARMGAVAGGGTEAQIEAAGVDDGAGSALSLLTGMFSAPAARSATES